MKTHSLLPNNVKTVIDAKIKGLPVDEQQFMFYHLNRNKFNVKNEVTSLKSIGGSRFRDNLGFVWEEQSITSMEYQETYNFGRTRNFSQHKALDVNPHNENPNYILRQDMGWVNIQE